MLKDESKKHSNDNIQDYIVITVLDLKKNRKIPNFKRMQNVIIPVKIEHYNISCTYRMPYKV